MLLPFLRPIFQEICNLSSFNVTKKQNAAKGTEPKSEYWNMLEPLQILTANMTDFRDSKVKPSALFMECPFSFRDSVHPQKWKNEAQSWRCGRGFSFSKGSFYFFGGGDGIPMIVWLIKLDQMDMNPKSELCTLPETNSSHLKIGSWKMNFLLGWVVFRGYVGFRECR